jgi:SAM-dependent methyltransferase
MPAPSNVTADEYDPPLAACPLCTGGPLHRRLRDFRGHGIDACGGCGVEFMNPQYTDDSLARFYAGYISFHPDAGSDRFRRREHVRLAGKERGLQQLAAVAPGRRILMVGCGDGLEIRAGKAGGWQVEAYDVDPKITAEVAAREAVPVHCGDFHALPQRTGAFDALFLDQVIEHPKDPGRYLQTCKALLRQGGALYLGMPNMGSLSNRLKTAADRLGLRGKRARHYNTRHHLTYFTPGVMVRHLRERVGMDVLHVAGSPKPQRNPLVRLVHGLGPFFDSSFYVIARKLA